MLFLSRHPSTVTCRCTVTCRRVCRRMLSFCLECSPASRCTLILQYVPRTVRNSQGNLYCTLGANRAIMVELENMKIMRFMIAKPLSSERWQTCTAVRPGCSWRTRRDSFHQIPRTMFRTSTVLYHSNFSRCYCVTLRCQCASYKRTGSLKRRKRKDTTTKSGCRDSVPQSYSWYLCTNCFGGGGGRSCCCRDYFQSASVASANPSRALRWRQDAQLHYASPRALTCVCGCICENTQCTTLTRKSGAG